MSERAAALADRIVQGAEALASFAEGLSDQEWTTTVPKDGRSVGVIVHHVATVYPLEVLLAQKLAGGEAITGVTMDAIADMNANHAKDHRLPDKDDTIALLRKNGKSAADAVRGFSDAQLDNAATVSLNGDAPLTSQFFIEDHALRHSFHHRARIRAALGKQVSSVT